VLSKASPRDEPALGPLSEFLGVIAAASMGSGLGAHSARDLLVKLLRVGGAHPQSSAPDRRALERFVAPGLAPWVGQIWPEVRALAESYDRWRNADHPSEASDEEAFVELGLSRVLSAPGAVSSPWLDGVVASRASSHARSEDDVDELTSRTMEKLLGTRRHAQEKWKPSGSPKPLLKSLGMKISGIVKDEAGRPEAPGLPQSSTRRTWRKEYQEALSGSLVLPEEIMGCFEMLFGREPATGAAREALLKRTKALRDARQRHQPTSADGEYTLAQIADMLELPKQKVKDTFRALQRRDRSTLGLAQKKHGTWVLTRAGLAAIAKRLGRLP